MRPVPSGPQGPAGVSSVRERASGPWKLLRNAMSKVQKSLRAVARFAYELLTNAP
jgi:hypothetical protein